jgi:hypothetical protein
VVERAGLENRCTASRYRGFESHLLRLQVIKSMLSTAGAASNTRLLLLPIVNLDGRPVRLSCRIASHLESCRRIGTWNNRVVAGPFPPLLGHPRRGRLP